MAGAGEGAGAVRDPWSTVPKSRLSLMRRPASLSRDSYSLRASYSRASSPAFFILFSPPFRCGIPAISRPTGPCRLMAAALQEITQGRPGMGHW